MLDRLAEHDIARTDGQVGPDKIAHQGAQAIEVLVLPAELQDLIDASEQGLRPFVAGTRVPTISAGST